MINWWLVSLGQVSTNVLEFWVLSKSYYLAYYTVRNKQILAHIHITTHCPFQAYPCWDTNGQNYALTALGKDSDSIKHFERKSKHDWWDARCTEPVASSSPSSHTQIHYNCSGCSGTLTGMLGDEQRNQTLAYTGLETLRPYFRLFHASCSHFFFCLVVFATLSPSSLSLHLLWTLALLFPSSSHVSGSLFTEESGECPGRRPVLLQSLLLLIHLSLAFSLSPLRLSLVPFITLLHHISYISLSSFNPFSMLHIPLCSIHLPPSPLLLIRIPILSSAHVVNI